MKILVVREIKIFFLLFFSYINKNFSCDCCDECWENFYPSKKPSSKYSDKNKKLDILSIIDEVIENEEEEEEENKEENEEGKEEGNEEGNEKERIKRKEEERKKEEEERKKKEEEEDKKEEEERKEYLESLLEDITKVRILKDDFFTEKKYIYERGRELGKGSYGFVCKIKKNNGKVFALKRIDVKDHNNLEEIQKEIQNMILLRNEKNIVKIFDVYKQDNFVGKFFKKKYSKKDNAVCFFIIMEFCENGDLDGFIKNKKIPDKENLRDKIAYQIINAVHSCYKERIAHRDLKPQNIFLDKDLNVKLGDFGLSDIFEYDGKDGLRVGSLRYMCYEKIQRKGHNPFKADLYSLGVILYELYTELAYSKGERKIYIHKNGKNVVDGYEDDFFTNKHVKDKLNQKLADEKYKNLKILLTGLLTKFEEDRWGWKEIFDSEFYKELQKNIMKINHL